MSFWGALVRVVTNVVNPRAFSLKMAVFWLRLTTFVTGVLARRCESRWFDDVCNGYCPRVPQSGPVGQVGRLSETVVAFARSCSCGIETVVAFARSCLCGIETAIAFAGAGRASAETVVAFAGEKWAFWVRFSVAEVMVVSMVAVQGRAVVMVVSKSPRCRASCAKKFALHAQNTPQSAFSRVLGEFFRGNAAEGAVLGEFFRANRPCAQVL